MSKFKVGDKLVRVSAPTRGLPLGTICTVLSICYWGIKLEEYGVDNYFDPKYFELVQEKPQPKAKGHPHAELMAQYAEDAKETDKPWERWEVLGNNGYSIMLLSHPTWHPSVVYRRKPSTININGYEVPEPVRVLQGGETYYCPYIGTGRQELDIAQWRHGSGFIVPRHLVEMGLVHTTREAAELHAKALLSFTNGKG